jgi:hypothetical protein
VPKDLLTPKTNQEREASLEGREAVVIVSPGKVPRQPIVFEVMRVKSDETLADWDETVKLWRKLTALWNTADPDQRRSKDSPKDKLGFCVLLIEEPPCTTGRKPTKA